MSTYTGGGTTRTRGAPQGGGQGSRRQLPRPIAEPAAGPAHTGAKALAAGLIGSAALVIPAAAAWASPSSILPAVPHTGSTASTASGLAGPGTQFRTSAIEQPIVAAKSSSLTQHHNGQPGTARSRVAEATLTAVVRPADTPAYTATAQSAARSAGSGTVGGTAGSAGYDSASSRSGGVPGTVSSGAVNPGGPIQQPSHSGAQGTWTNGDSYLRGPASAQPSPQQGQWQQGQQDQWNQQQGLQNSAQSQHDQGGGAGSGTANPGWHSEPAQGGQVLTAGHHAHHLRRTQTLPPQGNTTTSTNTGATQPGTGNLTVPPHYTSPYANTQATGTQATGSTAGTTTAGGGTATGNTQVPVYDASGVQVGVAVTNPATGAVEVVGSGGSVLGVVQNANGMVNLVGAGGQVLGSFAVSSSGQVILTPATSASATSGTAASGTGTSGQGSQGGSGNSPMVTGNPTVATGSPTPY